MAEPVRESCRPEPARTGHRPRADRQAGAAMVELAIILPLLVMMVFGIIQFGIAFNRVQGLHAAAREGARVASLPTSTAGDVQGRVNESLAAMNFTANPAAISPNGCAGRRGAPITVRVTAPYTVSIPLIPNVNVMLTGEGVFRCE
jgi:Flp pilus assembly protein TadG